jgi:hypothetical protein
MSVARPAAVILLTAIVTVAYAQSNGTGNGNGAPAVTDAGPSVGPPPHHHHRANYGTVHGSRRSVSGLPKDH